MRFRRNLSGRRLSWIAAAAGSLMLAGAAGPAAAFPLAAGPALAGPDQNAGVERVWWDRWGNWRPNHPRWAYGPPPSPRWAYGGPAYGYYGPVRHCWIGPWGHRHCSW